MVNLKFGKSWMKQDRNKIESELSLSVLKCASDLSDKYRDLSIAHGGGVWNKRHLESFDVTKFRGDNVYVWQTRVFQEIHFFTSYLYALKVDKLGLHNRFIEEGSFGVETFNFEGRLVSRDLIDSIIEISYLEEKFQMSKTKVFRILDIGAGYGRFAKRIQEGFNNIEVSCIDAIPLSTCLSRVYLEGEIKVGRVTVHQLDTMDEVQDSSINLAINIHSFSEMSMTSVESWVRFLVEKRIENIFIVPNGPNLALNDGSDFGGLFENAGYHIESVGDKFSDPDFSRFGIYPSKYFLLKRAFT